MKKFKEFFVLYLHKQAHAKTMGKNFSKQSEYTYEKVLHLRECGVTRRIRTVIQDT